MNAGATLYKEATMVLIIIMVVAEAVIIESVLGFFYANVLYFSL